MSVFRIKSVAEIERSLHDDVADKGPGLRRTLSAFDLVMLGIGAVIGAGIFSTLGTAAVGEAGVRLGAGPALVLSFVLLGAVCALAGLCYAELTAMIPISGSAYTYAYATLGELVAWIIGWDLMLEYAIGNVAVAIAWSDYFTSLLRVVSDVTGLGLEIPYWLTTSYRNVAISFPDRLGELPLLFGHRIAVNVPGTVIIAAITWVLAIGIRESSRVNNAIVILKLLVLALFVGVGVFYVDPANWHPFAPNGWQGIHQGAAIVFFAFIGFDAVSTAAEETKDPQRSMPIGILGSLAICTVIYVVVGGIATGLVPYTDLKGSDPLARAFELRGVRWMHFILALGAVISMTAVLLVFQLGQTRIFFSMSRDGLLPSWFRRVHPRYGTPFATTIWTGAIVAVLSSILDDDETYDLTNIGTLFAFLVVCLGVLALRIKEPDRPRPFRVPFVWVVAPLGAASCIYVMTALPTTAWVRFGIWMGAGMIVYFAFGYRNSRLVRAGDPGS